VIIAFRGWYNGAGWWYNFRYIVRGCTLAPWTVTAQPALRTSRIVIIWTRLTVRAVHADVFEKLARRACEF